MAKIRFTFVVENELHMENYEGTEVKTPQDAAAYEKEALDSGELMGTEIIEFADKVSVTVEAVE